MPGSILVNRPGPTSMLKRAVERRVIEFAAARRPRRAARRSWSGAPCIASAYPKRARKAPASFASSIDVELRLLLAADDAPHAVRPRSVPPSLASASLSIRHSVPLRLRAQLRAARGRGPSTRARRRSMSISGHGLPVAASGLFAASARSGSASCARVPRSRRCVSRASRAHDTTVRAPRDRRRPRRGAGELAPAKIELPSRPTASAADLQARGTCRRAPRAAPISRSAPAQCGTVARVASTLARRRRARTAQANRRR